jgi:hypothetical protein
MLLGSSLAAHNVRAKRAPRHGRTPGPRLAKMYKGFMYLVEYGRAGPGGLCRWYQLRLSEGLGR